MHINAMHINITKLPNLCLLQKYAGKRIVYEPDHLVVFNPLKSHCVAV
jgi:hypothetical protein